MNGYLLAFVSVLFAWSLGAQPVSALEILAPPELAGITIPSPEFYCLSRKTNIKGWLFDGTFTNVSLETIRANASRMELVALIQSDTFYVTLNVDGQTLNIVEGLKRIGVKGLVNVNYVLKQAGLGETLVPERSNCDDSVGFMFYEVGYVDGATLQNHVRTYGLLNVNIPVGDVNPWRQISRGPVGIAWRVIFTLSAGILSSYTLAKWIAFIRKAGGLQMSIPQVCLAVAFVANLFRTVYSAVDPVYFGLAFNGPGANMTATISVPANIIITLAIAFYWRELIEKAEMVQSITFLSKLKIPFIVLSVLVTIVEILSSALRASPIPTSLTFVTTIAVAFYLIIVVFMTIFFMYSGIKVLRYVQISSAAANLRDRDAKSSKSFARKAAILLMAACGFNVIWVIGLISAGVPSFFWTPNGFYTAWALIWVGILGSNAAQVAAFKFPKSRGKILCCA